MEYPPDADASARLAPIEDSSLKQLRLADEVSHVQRGPGAVLQKGAFVCTGDVFLSRMVLDPRFLGHAVPNADYVGVLLPLHRDGEYWFNGSPARRGDMLICSSPSGYCTRGERADVLVFGLPKAPLAAAIAALRGVEGEPAPPTGLYRLGGPLAEPFLSRMAGLVRAATRTDPSGRPVEHDAAATAINLIVDAFLSAIPLEAAKSGQSAARIVRRTEEHFNASLDRKVSLADLCMAAGVGRTQLYAAFRELHDETPLGYIKKRRMTIAHETLKSTPPIRGAIKRAALGAGFTELGRFSVEYRRLFGETPSATLSDGPSI